MADKITESEISTLVDTSDGTEVTLGRPGTNLQWFRVKADGLWSVRIFNQGRYL